MWGTVCDDFWSSDDAEVVCKQLGYQTEGAIAFTRAAFGQGTGSIILDNLNCNGNESNIFDCPHNGETIHNCGHDEDAGVFCPIPGITNSEHFRHVQEPARNIQYINTLYKDSLGFLKIHN